MIVLIAGGRGFLGRALAGQLEEHGHQVLVLTRGRPEGPAEIRWDGRTGQGWAAILNEVDAVVNLTGYSLNHWPWTKSRKRKFLESRVLPGRALAEAVAQARVQPRVFVQTSGVSRYGPSIAGVADESTPAADDYSAQLTVETEAATKPVEALGVRRVITRNAVVLDAHRGLLPVMALPVRLFAAGRHGGGRQALPWIHLADYTAAVRFLIEHEEARGPYNLVAPALTTNQEFMHELAGTLRRPYWFHTPAFLLRALLGEMSSLLLQGCLVRPKRLAEQGYAFRFGELRPALEDLFHQKEN